MNDNRFYTLRGYAIKDQKQKILTPSMEDYLEMIFRITEERGYTRVNELAEALNVQPPSVTKMAQKLYKKKLIKYEKYGILQLTLEGKKLGEYLLYRHNTIYDFLKIIGLKDKIHENTERLEHNISHDAMDRILEFIKFFKSEPGLLKKYRDYKKRLQNGE